MTILCLEGCCASLDTWLRGFLWPLEAASRDTVGEILRQFGTRTEDLFCHFYLLFFQRHNL